MPQHEHQRGGEKIAPDPLLGEIVPGVQEIMTAPSSLVGTV